MLYWKRTTKVMQNKETKNNASRNFVRNVVCAVCALAGLAMLGTIGYFALFIYAVGQQVSWH